MKKIVTPPTPSRRLKHKKKSMLSWKSAADASSVISNLMRAGYYGTLLWTMLQNII